jgi:hypothetical protein
LVRGVVGRSGITSLDLDAFNLWAFPIPDEGDIRLTRITGTRVEKVRIERGVISRTSATLAKIAEALQSELRLVERQRGQDDSALRPRGDLPRRDPTKDYTLSVTGIRRQVPASANLAGLTSRPHQESTHSCVGSLRVHQREPHLSRLRLLPLWCWDVNRVSVLDHAAPIPYRQHVLSRRALHVGTDFIAAFDHLVTQSPTVRGGKPNSKCRWTKIDRSKFTAISPKRCADVIRR